MKRREDGGIHHDLMVRLLDGDGRASVMLRRAAFEKAGLDDGARVLVEKVATNAAQVTDEDFDTARRAGLGEDEIWEIVVCAAVGQATRQYLAATAVLGEAVEERRR
jgi:alkylhydroperoxidase family enzyme